MLEFYVQKESADWPFGGFRKHKHSIVVEVLNVHTHDTVLSESGVLLGLGLL